MAKTGLMRMERERCNLKGAMVTERNDDASLLRAIGQHRDRAAFAKLLHRYHRTSFNFARRIVHNSELAEDVVQETMLAVWQSAEKYRPEGDAQRWIMGIVANKSMAMSRNQTRRSKREECVAMEQGRSNSIQAEGAEHKEILVLLRNQLDQLPELESQLLAYRYGASLSQQKIAELFNLSRSRVAEKLQMALKRLRGNLTKAGVAAVTPMLCEENLLQAITNSYEPPLGMTKRITERIENTLSMPSEGMNAGRGKAWTTLIAGVAIIMAASSGLWWKSTNETRQAPDSILDSVKSAEAAPSDAKPPVPTASTSDSPYKPLNRRWNFATGPAADLEILHGSWSWNRKHGDMICSKQTFVDLPVKIQRYPVVVEMKIRGTSRSIFQTTTTWYDGKVLSALQLWTTPIKIAALPNTFRVKTYFLGRHKVIVMNNQLQGVAAIQSKRVPRQIMVVTKNCALAEIQIREITLKEIPEAFRDPPKIMETSNFSWVSSPSIDLPARTTR